MSEMNYQEALTYLNDNGYGAYIADLTEEQIISLATIVKREIIRRDV